MKTIKQSTVLALLLACTASVSVVLAAAGQQLQDMTGQMGSSNKTEVRLKFSSAVELPKSFTLENPPRLVFDFPSTEINPNSRHKDVNLGQVQSVEAADNKGKARVVVRMKKFTNHSVELQGNEVVLSFDADTTAETVSAKSEAASKEDMAKPMRSGKQNASTEASALTKSNAKSAENNSVELPELPPAKPLDSSYAWYGKGDKNKAPAEPVVKEKVTPVEPAIAPAPVAVAAPEPAPAPARVDNAPVSTSGETLQALDFRREQDGSGKVIITLPSSNTKITDEKKGNAIIVAIDDVDVPAHLKKRMNVLDYGTPVSEVNVSQSGMNARVSITGQEGFDYRTQRRGNEYTIYIDKRKASAEEKLTTEKKKQNFTGEKLSLNFQDIEVRAVLQLLADFTNKNIVVSDTVQGNITVRLKDVPWDQALDIVLQSKNLAMRENGNVIWVAPATELDAKEKQELEAIQSKQQLEPLITEYIAINFAKAHDLSTLIEKSKGGEGDKQSLLSPRGKVSVDDRTNTLLIQDTVTQVKAIRELIKALDVPVQQVLIESRIVVANDTYGKELGSRFGVTPTWANGDTVGIGTGKLGTGTTNYFNSIAESAKDSSKNVTLPSLSDRLSVNLPVTGAAGSFGFSILSKDFMIDLELSALQAESKGEVISSPKVLTSNQTKALIEQGVEIPYQEATSSGATSVSFKKAVLSLEVTPQITPDEHVSMDLKVNQDSRGEDAGDIPTINTRKVQTKVLVENGQTVVLGGVHEEENLKKHSKVPVLGDVPVVGTLFRSDAKSNVKRELLIFVTPKIVDSK